MHDKTYLIEIIEADVNGKDVAVAYGQASESELTEADVAVLRSRGYRVTEVVGG